MEQVVHRFVLRTVLLGILLALFFLFAEAAHSQQQPRATGTFQIDGHALSGLVTMPAVSGTTVFNGAGATVFLLTLSGDATVTLENLLPGTVYVFEIIEPATGPTYNLTFPKNCYNFVAVNKKAAGITVVVAVALTDGSLLGIGGVTA